MQAEFQQMSLTTVANGAAVELFDQAIKEVVDNILDENRDPTAKRKIVMVFDVQSNKERNVATIGVQVKTTLCSIEKTESSMLMRKERGKVKVYAHHIEEPELFDESGNVKEVRFKG